MDQLLRWRSRNSTWNPAAVSDASRKDNTQKGEQKPATVHASLPPTSPLKLYGGGALGTQDLGSYGFIWDDIETGSAHERLETGTIVSLLFVHFLLLWLDFDLANCKGRPKRQILDLRVSLELYYSYTQAAGVKTILLATQPSPLHCSISQHCHFWYLGTIWTQPTRA